MSRLNDLKYLNEIRKSGICCSAEVLSRDGVSFPVHPQVLMANSMYFWSAFQFGPDEGMRGLERTIITVPNIDSIILAVVLRFLYITDITLDKSNVWSILRAADYLQIKILTEECLKFLKNNMCATTCINIIKLLHEGLYLPEVNALSIDYILQNVCEPRRSLEVRRSLVSHVPLEELTQCLDKDNLNAPYEQLVWDCIVAWITHDPENRKQYLQQLLSTLRIGQLNELVFHRGILRHPALLGNPDAFSDLTSRENRVNSWLRSPIYNENFIPKDLVPRLPNEIVLVFGGWCVSRGPSAEILVYDLQANKWNKIHENGHVCPLGLAFHGVVRLDHYVYVIGGLEKDIDTDNEEDEEDEVSYVDTARCYRFNLHTLKWESLPPLTIQRNYVSCGVVDGLVYAIGGRDLHQNENDPRPRLRSVEVFRPNTHQWHLMPSMNHRRSDAGIAVLGKKIYIFGGNSGLEILSSVECYDTTTREWTLLSPMASPRVSFKCVVLRDQIYLLGGSCDGVNTRSVLRFDPSDGSWQEMAPMRVSRSVFAAVAIRDMMILVAGGHAGYLNSHVEIYNAFENKWYSLTSLPSPRSGLNAVVIEGDSDLRSRLLQSERATRAGRHVRPGPVPLGYPHFPHGNELVSIPTIVHNTAGENDDDYVTPFGWLFAIVPQVPLVTPLEDQDSWEDDGDDDIDVYQTD